MLMDRKIYPLLVKVINELVAKNEEDSQTKTLQEDLYGNHHLGLGANMNIGSSEKD